MYALYCSGESCVVSRYFHCLLHLLLVQAAAVASQSFCCCQIVGIEGYWQLLMRQLGTRTFSKTYTHTHTRLTALFPGLPGWADTRKVKPIWILLKQETVSGSGISWAICKSAPHSRQITTRAPHHSCYFTGRMPFLPANQQRQSTEGDKTYRIKKRRLAHN